MLEFYKVSSALLSTNVCFVATRPPVRTTSIHFVSIENDVTNGCDSTVRWAAKLQFWITQQHNSPRATLSERSKNFAHFSFKSVCSYSLFAKQNGNNCTNCTSSSPVFLLLFSSANPFVLTNVYLCFVCVFVFLHILSE